ncbi:MAG: DUF308 domain-containing protein, partial [Methanobacterium sp.]
MNDTRNVLVGILAVILGLIVIFFPLISVFTINEIAGIGIIFLGFWFLSQSLKTRSLAAGVAGLLLTIFALLLGIVFIKDIKAFEFFTFIALYIVGFFIILAGLAALISFAEKVENPSQVGFAFGKVESIHVNADLLPSEILSPEPKRREFARGFVWAMFQRSQWSWFDAVNTAA